MNEATSNTSELLLQNKYKIIKLIGTWFIFICLRRITCNKKYKGCYKI